MWESLCFYLPGGLKRKKSLFILIKEGHPSHFPDWRFDTVLNPFRISIEPFAPLDQSLRPVRYRFNVTSLTDSSHKLLFQCLGVSIFSSLYFPYLLSFTLRYHKTTKRREARQNTQRLEGLRHVRPSKDGSQSYLYGETILDPLFSNFIVDPTIMRKSIHLYSDTLTSF